MPRKTKPPPRARKRPERPPRRTPPSPRRPYRQLSAGEDEAPAPSAETTRKTAEEDTPEPAPAVQATAAGEDEAPAPSAETTRKTAEEDTPEPAPAVQATAAGEDEDPPPSAETTRKTAEEDTPEPAPAIQATAAGEDEAPAPSEEAAEKPTEDAVETGTAGEGAPMAAAGELLKKADDDISDLVSDRGTATTREEESAAPGKETAEKLAKGADESATEAEPSPAAEEDDATTPAKKPALRDTEETAAPPGTITIRELLEGTVEVGEHDVFYVHAVTPEDYQGLWGIIQNGVTENFARGVRLTTAGQTDTYRIAVPEDADEVLDDRSSSPLGLMIHRKSRETIVYNRELGRLTLDPDVTIYPGNELVIVGFKPEELIDLYKHFAGTDGG